MSNSLLLADPDRFRPIKNPRSDFPGLGFTGADSFDLDGEDLLITERQARGGDERSGP
jgi:hypothetical protein